MQQSETKTQNNPAEKWEVEIETLHCRGYTNDKQAHGKMFKAISH